VSPPLSRLLPAVALGGAVGALARYGISELLPEHRGELPVGTLLVNLVGCLLLGVLVAHHRESAWLRPVLGTGVLGGFTTFSTFAVQSDHLLDRAPGIALLYVAVSVLGGLAAVQLGLRLRM
jgi:CrcB protein